MSRDGSGTYTRPGGTTAWVDDRNAAVKIRADLHDTHDQDIADALTASMASDGQTAATARIPFAFGFDTMDGTVGAPGWSFTSDPDTGWYRIGSNNMGAACGGQLVLNVSTSGLAVGGFVTSQSFIRTNDGSVAAPGFSFTLDTNTGWYRIGTDNMGAACNGAKVLDIGVLGLDVTGTLSSSGALSGVTSGTITRSGANPALNLIRSDTHGDGVQVGEVIFTGRDSGAASQQYAAIRVNSTSDNAAAEEGEFEIRVTTAGVDTEVVSAKGSGVAFKGTNTNDSAAAGFVGEYPEVVVASGSAVSLTNGTAANLSAGFSLTAGDWEVWTQLTFSFGATTNITKLQASISAVSATLDASPGYLSQNIYAPFVPGADTITIQVGPVKKSLSGTTTIYPVARAVFSVSTCTVFGIIKARRVR